MWWKNFHACTPEGRTPPDKRTDLFGWEWEVVGVSGPSTAVQSCPNKQQQAEAKNYQKPPLSPLDRAPAHGAPWWNAHETFFIVRKLAPRKQPP